jgi:hypothetical protein
MGAMIGFVLGYVLGTRAGDRGWEELQESWRTISSSEEVRALVTGGILTAGEVFRQAVGSMAERIGSRDDTSLRRVA